MTDLKNVIADFSKTSAFVVLDDLVRVCGIDSVLSALSEIAAAQQERGADSICWQCHYTNSQHSLDCTVGNSTGGSR